MKVKINIQRIAVSVVLFIIFGYVNAQDTIRCSDSRYYWNEPCDSYGDNPHNFTGIDLYQPSLFTITDDGKPEVWPPTAVDKVLTQQVFTDTIRREIFGIAGTPVECHNPNGCYFYLYKKIGDTFVVLDSAEWTHRNIDDNDIKYIEYPVDFPDSIFDIDCDIYDQDTILSYLDHNIPQIYEAYFDRPIAVEDTFYIGTNWNGLIYTHCHGDTWMFDEYLCTLIVPLGEGLELNSLSTNWIFMRHYTNSWDEENSPVGRNCFFPIMQPPSCIPINAVRADNITNSSVHISWEQSYLSSYYQIEYGPSGFQHGTGILVDSITTTDYTLQGLTSGEDYTAYVRSYCSETDTVSSWKYVKFKTFNAVCPIVEDFGTAHVSDKMVRIEWKITDSEISLCQIEWGEAGFEHGNGTIINNIHDTTYIFRNLTPNTTYDIYLRTYCERSQVFGQWQKLTVTTNGDSTTAISTIDSDIPVELHPNPTSGIITLSRNDIQKVEVMDATGKVVMIVDNKNVIDLSKLTKGYYTLRITLPEGVAIRKVIRN